MKTLLITGGLGFIGSHFILQEIEKGHKIINLDINGYAADERNLSAIQDHENYIFVEGDIGDSQLVSKVLVDHNIAAVINFAAESHVDNSINAPDVFIKTNIEGTYNLLQSSLAYYQNIENKESFRFIHVSTDEVFGDLDFNAEEKFSESTAYNPRSPYSASKAASDHLVKAWFHTFGLPTIVTNCSNNFGPHQHHEKLIPTIISSALSGKNIPIYGEGKNIRDWLFVKDHCQGISLALQKGHPGESYCFGGGEEKQNIEIAQHICNYLDNKKPKEDGQSYKDQISFVADRKGHDRRYAINDQRSRSELGYTSTGDFESCLNETIEWYLDHEDRLS
ncbi:MAG: dTDP-glucose 4,6-dehydratase [Pseudomonadota bacterium]